MYYSLVSNELLTTEISTTEFELVKQIGPYANLQPTGPYSLCLLSSEERRVADHGLKVTWLLSHLQCGSADHPALRKVWEMTN